MFFSLISLISFLQLSAQADALPKENIWSKKSESGWEIVGQDKFYYDDQSRIIEMIGTSPMDSNSRTKFYRYLDDSSRMEVQTEMVDGKMETFSDSIIMHSNGVEISYEWEGMAKKKWMPSLKRTIARDSIGNIVRETYERYKESKWNFEDRMLYLFEGKQCKEEYFQMREDEDWVTHQKSVHHYNQQGLLSSTEIYSQNKTVLIPERLMQHPYMRIVYRYGKDGNLLERVAQTLVQGKWTDEFKRNCIY